MNGTYVNGQRVTISRIDNGSVFKIGSNEGNSILTEANCEN